MKNNKGFTLLELMIAVLLSFIVSWGLYMVYSSTIQSRNIQEQNIEMYQNLRSGMFLMAREFRMIGYDPQNISESEVSRGRITNASPSSITFSYVSDADGINNDGDGEIDEDGELTIVDFRLQDCDDRADCVNDGLFYDLVRTDLSGPAPSATTIAENIEQIEFFYTQMNNAGIEDRTQPPGNMRNIKSIRVTMLAISSKVNPTLRGARTYPVPDGVPWNIPADDRFSRKMLSTVINCRNMGN